MKRAFIFPGQGVQTAGMGKDFYEKYKSSREVFDKIQSDPRMLLDIKYNCFSDYISTTPISSNTQLYILATELAIAKALLEEGIIFDATAGLSLGEFSALHLSGLLSLEDVCWLVCKRGYLMQKLCDSHSGMDIVLDISESDLATICNESSNRTKSVLTIANYNCPGQLVISGQMAALEDAEKILKVKGNIIVPLTVPGAFHNNLIGNANKIFIEKLNEVSFGSIVTPYVDNVTGDFVSDKYTSIELVKQHMVSPVYWQKSIETMISSGIEEFIEVGPKHTLTSMIRKINPNVKAVSISTVKDLDKYLGRL